MDIRKLIDSSPMGLRQWSIIFVALYFLMFVPASSQWAEANF